MQIKKNFNNKFSLTKIAHQVKQKILISQDFLPIRR